MRIMWIAALAAAACGGAGSRGTTTPPPTDNATADGADPAPPEEPLRADGRLVVQLTPLTGDVAEAAALDGVVRSTATAEFEAEHTFATDGGRASYRLDAVVKTLAVEGAGPFKVRCKLSMIVSTMPDRAILAMTDAAASVETPDAAGGESSCVQAVVQQLVGQQIIPMLQKHGS